MSLLLLYGLISITLCYIIYEKWLKHYIGKENKQKYFAELFHTFPIFYNTKVGPRKKTLFESLFEMESYFPELRKKGKGCVRILELGIGPGANFEYFPKNCHLIANDPNKYFTPFMTKNLDKYPGIVLEKQSPSRAENLIDIESESVDAVVSTTVCCSVKDLQKVLQEVRRVLVPGGKFLYLEHIVDIPGSWRRLLQQLVDAFGIWNFICDGCHCSRETDICMENAGFAEVKQDRFYINTDGWIGLHVVKSHLVGVSIK